MFGIQSHPPLFLVRSCPPLTVLHFLEESQLHETGIVAGDALEAEVIVCREPAVVRVGGSVGGDQALLLRTT